MKVSVNPGVTCLVIPRSEWDEGSLESVTLHVVKDVLVFESEHTLLTAYTADKGNMWEPYALAGWYGFARGGTWVLLVQKKYVQGIPR